MTAENTACYVQYVISDLSTRQQQHSKMAVEKQLICDT